MSRRVFLRGSDGRWQTVAARSLSVRRGLAYVSYSDAAGDHLTITPLARIHIFEDERRIGGIYGRTRR